MPVIFQETAGYLWIVANTMCPQLQAAVLGVYWSQIKWQCVDSCSLVPHNSDFSVSLVVCEVEITQPQMTSGVHALTAWERSIDPLSELQYRREWCVDHSSA